VREGPFAHEDHATDHGHDVRALGSCVMSTHIGGAPGDVAPVVLMPGDPLRARWIAETFLDDARCYTEVRGMLGYTGTWHGRPVSVQGSGMGQPSIAIYATELFGEYDVQSIVRVGSCGAAARSRRPGRSRPARRTGAGSWPSRWMPRSRPPRPAAPGPARVRRRSRPG
jgi:hypothetical protein